MLRLCLKHFRRHRFNEAFDALLRQSDVMLEHPLLTELHSQLVRCFL